MSLYCKLDGWNNWTIIIKVSSKQSNLKNSVNLQIKFEDQDSGDVFTCMVDDWIKLDDVNDGIKELPVCWPKNKILPGK